MKLNGCEVEAHSEMECLKGYWGSDVCACHAQEGRRTWATTPRLSFNKTFTGQKKASARASRDIVEGFWTVMVLQ